MLSKDEVKKIIKQQEVSPSDAKGNAAKPWRKPGPAVGHTKKGGKGK